MSTNDTTTAADLRASAITAIGLTRIAGKDTRLCSIRSTSSGTRPVARVDAPVSASVPTAATARGRDRRHHVPARHTDATSTSRPASTIQPLTTAWAGEHTSTAPEG